MGANLGENSLGVSAATLLLVLLCTLTVGHPDHFFAGSAVGGGVSQHSQGTAVTATVPLRGFICDRRSAHEPCEVCHLGFYCENETTMLPCPSAEFFCPLGSVAPVRVKQGFYSLPLATNHSRHYEEPCPEGFFCTDGVKTICPKGYYCGREMLTSPVPCGEEYLYCQEGSVRPQLAKEGWFTTGGTPSTRDGQEIAPMGFFATRGVLKRCSAGYFGSNLGQITKECSGECEPGWYCPEGSQSPRQVACGSENVYCPKGSASPQQVQQGYYTTRQEEPCPPGTYREDETAGDVKPSPVTSFKPHRKCIRCPNGTFKYLPGDQASLCRECGPAAVNNFFRTSCDCHQSATDREVDPLIFDVLLGACFKKSQYTKPPDDHIPPSSQLTKTHEHPCELGHFCHLGVQYKCPRGSFGDRQKETYHQCSGLCEPGFFCEEGSPTPTQYACGGPDVYCPRGSSAPQYVREGYYTPENEEHKTTQILCPPGSYCREGLRIPCPASRFGSLSGQHDAHCDGVCEPGYFCPSDSTSSTQTPCGNSSVYCPEASATPIIVDRGYYSASDTNLPADFYSGPNSTHHKQVMCEIGYYCSGGIKYSCPAGTYGTVQGAHDASQCQECEAGYYCTSHPGPPTTNETRIECGKEDMFCPAGSDYPRQVDQGYFSINEYSQEIEDNSTAMTRTAQVISPKGWYAVGGVKRPCPAGTYGDTEGLSTRDCSGFCMRGWFCPLNSVSPIRCSPGSYSTGGAPDCTSCNVPLTVPMEVKNRMCRNKRSCCNDIF